jgi:hypothetical protein
MITHFTNIEFINAKSNDLLPCECLFCHNIFNVTKHSIQDSLNTRCKSKNKYCSYGCSYLAKKNKQKVICSNCSIEFEKTPNQIKKSKSGNHFCSRSCAATYNNTHKTTGNRRSKLEIYLEEQLIKLYPDLEIIFNNKIIINSELDIYIPSLKLAFELNGIFHYEPIYGDDKLDQIQNNDQRKFQACLEQGIELCIIDTSQQIKFKEKNSKKYLDIIINIINYKCGT